METTTEVQMIGNRPVEITRNGSRAACPGCGEIFRGAAGVRAHMSGRFVTAACRPFAKPVA